MTPERTLLAYGFDGARRDAMAGRQRARLSRAYAAIADVLAGAGKFLELELVDDSDRVWLFNARQIAGLRDEKASELARFRVPAE